MKLFSIAVLSTLAMSPSLAQDQAAADIEAEWKPVALQAQALQRQTRFAEAAVAGQKALVIAKRFGQSDPRLATTYHLLGIVYRDMGHCAEARASFSHAITVWRRTAEPNRHYLFNSVTSMISTMCECDDFTNAEKAYHTYKTDLEQGRTDALDEAKVVSLRAVLARGRKDYVQAETLYRESIRLLESSPKAKPVEIESERSSLAVVIDKQGRYEESLVESRHAIEFFERVAPRHPSFIASLNNAACSLADLGRKDESERMFQRALDVAKDLYGEDNRATAKIILNYAGVLRQNKQTPAAESWQKRGVDAFRRALIRDNATIDAAELRR